MEKPTGADTDIVARKAVYGRRAMLVSGHPLSTLAGWTVFERGGSAADAAIAAAAMQCVVLPSAVTVGGDGFGLLHDARARQTLALNASGCAPAAATLEAVRGEVPRLGPRSIAVPQIVRGWQALHQRQGRRPWAELIAPAIEAARDGFVVSRALASAIVAYRDLIAADPALAALLLPAGPLAEGAVLRQPALARTLSVIAEAGAEGFYRGPLSQAVARLAQRGGLMQPSDLFAREPFWCQPLQADVAGLRFMVPPPNSFGLMLPLQMNALMRQDWSAVAVGSAEAFAREIVAAREAIARGLPLVSDADDAPARAQALLDDATRQPPVATLAQAARQQGGTAVITAMDEEGHAAVLVQSIFTVFASGVLDAETGILFNNRLRGFCADPGDPNALAPLRRPAHTLSPALALDQATGLPRFLLASPGGPSQTITLAQVLVNRLALGQDMASAVALPRWSVDLEGGLLLEAGVADAVLQALRARGFEVNRSGANSPYFGSAEIIERLPGGALCGVADLRREALALGA